MTAVPKKERHRSPPDLKAVFTRFARRALKDFPELKDKFLVIDREHFDRTFGSLAEGKDKEYFTKTTIYTAQPPEGHHRAAATFGLSFDDKTSIRIILVHAFSKTKRTMLPADRSWIDEAKGVLDHELGHLVVPGGYIGRNGRLKETASDVFMQLRRMQRLQSVEAKNDLEANIWGRTCHMVLHGRQSHYTAAGLEILKNMDFKDEILGLSPIETANVACRIAETSVLGRGDFTPIFLYVRNAEGGLEQKLTTAVEVILKDPQRPFAALNACADFLSPFLEGHGKLTSMQFTPDEIAEIDLTTPYWNSVRDRIAEIRAQTIPLDKNQSRSVALLMDACKNERQGLYALGYLDAKPATGKLDAAEYLSPECTMARRATEIIYSLIRHMQENNGKIDIDTAGLLENPFGIPVDNHITLQARKGLKAAVNHLEGIQGNGTIECLSPKETAHYAVTLARMSEVAVRYTPPASTSSGSLNLRRD